MVIGMSPMTKRIQRRINFEMALLNLEESGNSDISVDESGSE